MSTSASLLPTIKLKLPLPPISTYIPVGPVIHTVLSPQEYSQVRQLEVANHSANSLRAYQSDWTHFISYCADKPLSDVSQIPEAVKGYLNSLYQQDYKMSTIERRVMGIKYFLHTLYQVELDLNQISKVLTGLRRELGTKKTGKNPLLKIHVVRMVDAVGIGNTNLQLRDRALLLVGFYSAMRRSELLDLKWSEVEITEDGVLLNLVKSKTDQIGKGRKIPLPYKNDAYCPIKTLLEWKSVCLSEMTQFVWRRIGKDDHIMGPLKTSQYYDLIKSYCLRIGLDISTYSPHSLRSGFVTQSDLSGASISLIQKTTGHRSDAMVRNYVRDPDNVLKNHAGQLF
jgi:site-specific recombinase XerD